MSRWLRWGRVAAAALIVAALLAAVDLRAAWAALAAAEPAYLAGCVAIYFAGVLLSCVKWRWLLAAQGLRAPLGQLVRWYLLGTLAGTLLPSDIGGDFGRGYLAGRSLGSPVAAWSSVLVERLTGVAALLALAAGSLALAPALLGWRPELALGVLAAGGAGAGLGLRLLRGDATPSWLPARARSALAQIREVAGRYQGRPGVLVACLAVSLLFHILNALSLWLVARAVTPAAPALAALVWPLVGLVGLLPLTPGGIGVREGALVLLLGRAAIAPEHALAVAVISRALLLLVSLAGLPPLLAELRQGPPRGGAGATSH